MKKMMMAGLLGLCAFVGTGAAQAKGCLKGAAVGGTAGHFAGHHAVLGAAGGCLVGHHYANKRERQQAAPANQPRDSNADMQGTRTRTGTTTQ